jgi:hypothetical protein
MTSTSESEAADSTGAEEATDKPHKHIHHGRTIAAWTGSILAMLAFILGGIAMVLGPNWVLFWIAAAILIIAVIVTKVLQVMGYGAN